LDKNWTVLWWTSSHFIHAKKLLATHRPCKIALPIRCANNFPMRKTHCHSAFSIDHVKCVLYFYRRTLTHVWRQHCRCRHFQFYPRRH
jgi:hypothetical protein